MSSSVDLGKHLEKVIAKLVSSGRYNSKSEVLREGVRLIEEREAKMASLDEALARAVAEADAGRTIPAKKVFAKLRKQLGMVKAARR
jgi:antitoxin ParD1/3/4